MTERIGNFFRKHIHVVQPHVEDLLQARLGNILILPAEGNFINIESLAFVKENTICYDTSPLAYVPTGRCLWATLAHELGHIAHHSLVGTPEFFCFKHVREGFADYVAFASMKSMRMESESRARVGARKFGALLSYEGMPDSIDGAVKYILMRSDVYRKSDGDHKMLNAAARI